VLSSKHGDWKEAEHFCMHRVYFGLLWSPRRARFSPAVSFYPTLLFPNISHTAKLTQQPCPKPNSRPPPSQSTRATQPGTNAQPVVPAVKLLATPFPAPTSTQYSDMAWMSTTALPTAQLKIFPSAPASSVGARAASFDSFELILRCGDHTNALLPPHPQRVHKPPFYPI
jgi:hypothetical protein